MLLSMTGFGKSVVEVENKKITCEIKSLNSKQLDMNVRVPAAYREHELELRARIGKVLERGKVEVIIYVENARTDASAQFNAVALATYKERIKELSAALGIPEPADWYSVLMRLPDVLKTDTVEEAADNEIDALMLAADQATQALMKHRRSEGEKLEDFFCRRISNIAGLLEEVPRHEAERVAKIRARIEDNIGKIPGVDYDNGRLEQEMIFYIEKLDINEEKQRLAQHLSYFTETMAQPQGQGKKLGFISQEIGREINTLGSKSNHAELQKLVVRMKDELEQIKEQVLNVM
ncbi:YicC family protein [Muribaculaceae bacterium Isolate-104 (HZI)]|nr:YicC family protein [Muribaculaceae bacterium Isolate-104 (HZI)]